VGVLGRSAVESLPNLIARHAERTPDAGLVREFQGGVYSYAQVWTRSLAWAGALRQAGVGAGDRVVTMGPPRAEWLSAWMGCAIVGAVETGVNHGFKGPMLDYSLTRADARVLLATGDVLAGLDPAVLRSARIRTVVVLDGPGGGREGLPTVEVTEFLADAHPAAPRSVAPDELACMTLTSGTTGPSKFVRSPWGLLWLGGTGALPPDDIGPEDCFASPLPVYHAAARFCIAAMALPGAAVAFGDRFEVGRYWADIAEHRCTLGNLAWFAKPLWDQPERADDAATPMRGALAGPMPPFYREFGERFGMRLCSAFGMSEVGAPISTGWDPPNHRTCGRVRTDVPGLDVRLLDPGGEEVRAGEMGELCVRSSEPGLTTLGYFGMPAETEQAWRGGWFHTGDGFRIDDDGWVYFVDRTKDAIRRRGRNISSFEVEAIVNSHPGVAESAAVAVPADDGQEEEVLLFVVRAEQALDPSELVAYLTEQMPRYMVPLYVEFIDELPKTETTLRVRKRELRERGVGPETWRRPSSRPEPLAKEMT